MLARVVGAAGAVTVIVGAIVALAGLPSHLGLTHDEREKHGTITLDAVDLTRQTLAGFRYEASAPETTAFRPQEQDSNPRLRLAAIGDGTLLAQTDVTAGESSPEPAPESAPDSLPPNGEGSDGSDVHNEAASGQYGNDESGPATTTTETTPTVQTTPPEPTTTTQTQPDPGGPSLPPGAEAHVASAGVPVAIPDGMAVSEFSDVSQEISRQVQDYTGVVGDDCVQDLRACPAMTALIAAALTDPAGAPVSVAVAVERLKRALPQMRRVETPEGPTVDGVGVAVTVHADDLEGETIFLKWQVVEQGRGRIQLYGEWLSAKSAYRIIPPSDDVSVDLPLWVPWPPGRGRYRIRLLVYLDGVPSLHKDVPLEL